LGINLLAFLVLRSEPGENSDLSKEEWEELIYNPYSSSGKNRTWKKTGIHIHSDRVWYTPERQSVADLVRSYQRNGFDWISLSDYGQVTDVREYIKESFDSYEWGNNLKKKHMLVLGTKKVVPDPFLFFSVQANLQWVLDSLNRSHPFVIINHPGLYNSFGFDDLYPLQGYHAIEVFNPYGEHMDLWDDLLKSGKPVWAVSSDDLHYLPHEESIQNEESFLQKFWKYISLVYGREGQAFERFILVNLDMQSSEESDILNELCQGNFLFVRKFHRKLPDFLIDSLEWNGVEFRIKLKEKVREILFFTGKKEPSLVIKNSSEAGYILRDIDPYVRVEVRDINGILGSNPVFRTKNMEKRRSCKPVPGEP
jgi:hypothetical protein